MINHFSSRVNNPGEAFFNKSLDRAVSYDRIAGYFSSSIIEIAGEQIYQMNGIVRVVCNSQLQTDDVKFIKDQSQAMKLEWCERRPEEELIKIPERIKKLYNYLTTSKIQVRVLPNDVFGLIHGKAGVITKSDGSKIAFIGSMNETYGGWGEKGNYEIAWVDDDNASIQWVQDEFDALWTHPMARPLTSFIIEDLQRIINRQVIYNIPEWRKDKNPASTVIESPVYRKEFGLWEHQKYFVDLAFKAHGKGPGARYVLADMVGLGKTVQLALSAMLMALEGEKPILIIVPKTLIWQWQEEMSNLLDMPSAVWNGSSRVDENNVEYPVYDESGLSKCPRRVGIISQGLIVRSREKVSEYLMSRNYECVIVDEAHRARRKNMFPGRENEAPKPNNLMQFLLDISGRTKSMLLATATPVQMNPVEAWDLLYILSKGADFVLGDYLSNWQREPLRGINIVTGREEIIEDNEKWEWLRNPFPPAAEKPETFGVFRRLTGMADYKFSLPGDVYYKLSPQNVSVLKRIFADEMKMRINSWLGIRYSDHLPGRKLHVFKDL